MKLYMSPASPFVHKCRIAVRELGLADRIEEVPTAVKPTEANLDYGARINPLRKIPALETDDGAILVDSRVIVAFLDEVAGGGRLVPAEGAARWRTLSAAAIAEGIMDCAVAARYERAVRPAETQWAPWAEDQLGKVDAALDWFEARVGTLEGAFDLKAATLAAALAYLDFRFAERDWRTARPKLAAWFEGVAARPSVAETRPA